MTNDPEDDLDAYDFALPEHLIALRPAVPRRASRLLLARGDTLADRAVTDLPSILDPGDLMVFNDTRVIPARLFGERRRETADGSGLARIETILLHREAADTWTALARPARRLRAGDTVRFGSLAATIDATGEGGAVTLRFDRGGPELDAAIEAEGVVPLPPYIANRRETDERDRADYQTIFAEKSGSVAAPTASLHFDDALMAALAARGVRQTRLTLHVGGGTFLPVRGKTLSGHDIHSEWGELPPAAAEAINATRAEGRRVIAVGTTALRLLETAVDETGRVHPWSGETNLFIKPGHRFRAIDGLMTNFHLPRSTLFALVSALMGRERMLAAYNHAIAQGYRFYSYGDSSLLLPEA
jgi:S-adenosylmethionine:tRNA ribosyltransferase-isomerase